MHKRSMPWRTEPMPYFVLVSEMMLQQTQVSRVVPKFNEFVQRFPDIASLANAPLSDVLARWSGLGYNRRAKFLWQAAQMVQKDFNGAVPRSVDQLTKLPGIGPNTAGAIMAYAYNEPTVFIETNIRTVFIHHFFNDHAHVITDAQLRDVVARYVPATNVREWYWALMDYGTHLKSSVGTYLERANAYRPQSKFEGSRRQVRGQVLRALLKNRLSPQQLATIVPDPRLTEVLGALEQEGLIQHRAGAVYLTGS